MISKKKEYIAKFVVNNKVREVEGAVIGNHLTIDKVKTIKEPSRGHEQGSGHESGLLRYETVAQGILQSAGFIDGVYPQSVRTNDTVSSGILVAHYSTEDKREKEIERQRNLQYFAGASPYRSLSEGEKARDRINNKEKNGRLTPRTRAGETSLGRLMAQVLGEESGAPDAHVIDDENIQSFGAEDRSDKDPMNDDIIWTMRSQDLAQPANRRNVPDNVLRAIDDRRVINAEDQKGRELNSVPDNLTLMDPPVRRRRANLK